MTERAPLRRGTFAFGHRLVGCRAVGSDLLHDVLERKIAALKGMDAAIVFGSGYLANVGTIPVFASEGDLILADELAHACMLSGAKLSGATVVLFRHNDVAHLRELLTVHRAGARHRLRRGPAGHVARRDNALAEIGVQLRRLAVDAN